MNTSDYRLPAGLEGTILAEIVDAKLKELAGATEKWPASAIENVLERAPESRSFKAALSRRSPAIIAELKKASPSAGLLRADFEPVTIAREYEAAGAVALSVITEVHHFHGGLENLARLRWHSGLPLLRKDFLIHRYQVLEARHAGADAVLLIAALLEGESLRRMREETERVGMQALVEVHTEEEMRRTLDSGATLVGVNNRDLRTFEVTLETSAKLARLANPAVTLVAESGIRTAADIARLRECGYSAFLVGETLMRSQSPGAALRELIGGRSRGRL